jgi:hypothetical protein
VTLTFFIGFSVGVQFMAVVRDCQMYGYHRRLLRGVREPVPLAVGLVAGGLAALGAVFDIGWYITPVALYVFASVTIWVSAREEARRQEAQSGTPNP